MAKSDGKRVQVSRKDVYEIKVGDRETLQLSEEEAGSLLQGLQQALAPEEAAAAPAAVPEVIAAPASTSRAAPAAEAAKPSRSKTFTPKQRRNQTLVMSGIVVVVIAAAFVGFNLTSSTGPSGPKLPPAAPYEHFSVTGEGDITYNGTSPGPAMIAPNDTNVWVSFTVSSSSSVSHSWVLVPGNTSHKLTTPDITPVFANATSPTPTTGTAPGKTDQIVFKVTKPGSYIYICEVPGHFQEGMWGYFNVTAGNTTTNATALPTHSAAVYAHYVASQSGQRVVQTISTAANYQADQSGAYAVLAPFEVRGF